MRSRHRFVPALFVAVAFTASTAPPAATAAPNAEQRCLAGRQKAAANYDACQHLAQARFETQLDVFPLQVGAGKCLLRYAASWDKLRAKAASSGSLCDNPRFADDGLTVTDRLTGLEWEKKTDDGSVHDKDNTYTWTVSVGGAADGTAWTVLLGTLNGSCFAGQCDWRLPTRDELQTILAMPYQCTVPPCIDPIFGLTNADSGSSTVDTPGGYWSASPVDADPPDAWFVSFYNSFVTKDLKSYAAFVRAVRGAF